MDFRYKPEVSEQILGDSFLLSQALDTEVDHILKVDEIFY